MIDEYVGLSREVKKMLNMSVMMIAIVVGVLGTVPKDLKIKTGGIRNKRKKQEW